MSHPDYPDLPDLPEHAVAAVRRFEESRAEVATMRERLSQLPQPDPEELRVDPVDEAERVQRLRAAAESGTAPPELIRLGRAVRAGETTYEAIASGAADDLPVVAAARQAALERFHQAVADGSIRLVPDHDAPAPSSSPAREDEPPESFMKPSW
ncbi:hypothetical protein [Labedaea rhizosphaerae]|uniref:Uncharacterized protein n=1 Tax=Labedaea rhizosphaerae TaxID=598644 RepID=A0A4R6SRN6_LABRH|nr:hypothetical protein [Labedaea rhizosphaerae]TDQ05963.1 hypothetical protein EV186_1011941 [Labedaea rhizosphaerae]